MTSELSCAVGVNQQLAFARALIEIAKIKLNAESIPERQQLMALLDAAVKQLRQALSFFIAERALAVKSNLRVDTDTLMNLLADVREQIPELPLLREVDQELKRKDWLHDLITAGQSSTNLSDALKIAEFTPDSKAGTAPAAGTILATTSKGPIETLEYWSQKIQAWVDFYRNTDIEE